MFLKLFVSVCTFSDTWRRIRWMLGLKRGEVLDGVSWKDWETAFFGDLIRRRLQEIPKRPLYEFLSLYLMHRSFSLKAVPYHHVRRTVPILHILFRHEFSLIIFWNGRWLLLYFLFNILLEFFSRLLDNIFYAFLQQLTSWIWVC